MTGAPWIDTNTGSSLRVRGTEQAVLLVHETATEEYRDPGRSNRFRRRSLLSHRSPVRRWPLMSLPPRRQRGSATVRRPRWFRCESAARNAGPHLRRWHIGQPGPKGAEATERPLARRSNRNRPPQPRSTSFLRFLHTSKATLFTPDGKTQALEIYKTDEGSGVDTDRVRTAATVKLEGEGARKP